MKKLLTTLALAVAATTAFADSVTFEGAGIKYDNGSADQKWYRLGYTHNISKNLTTDVGITETFNDSNGYLANTRTEIGLTPSTEVGPLKLAFRAGYGVKMSSTYNHEFYSLEPMAIYKAGDFSYKLGFRWRSQTGTMYNDQTHTTRYVVGYAINKTNSVNLGYDVVKGDTQAKYTVASWVHSF
jgi:hypothetical protein